MELNRKASGKKTTVNPEGSEVLDRRPEIQLYLEASNLNLKKNSFYVYAQDKLDSLLKMAKEMDNDYVLGLSKFLSDRGLKTSPVILTSVLADKKFSFREEAPNLLQIFNTPQRIAESVALNDLDKIKLNNSFKKNVLKVALENMNDFTLKKNKLKHRKIKTRDLIKLLRPKPKNDTMSKLYKALIENSKEASLDEKTDKSMVTIKSSTKLKKEEKKELIEKNLDKIPINQLIRNLRYLAEQYDFQENMENQKKVIARLKSIDNYRILNIFDLITTSIHVPEFSKLLHEIIEKFVDKVKTEFDYGDDIVILFDTSGSMTWDSGGLENGFKYLVLFSALFKNVELRTFANSLHRKSPVMTNVINLIRLGQIKRAWDKFREYANQNSGGTALIESVSDIVEDYPENKNYLVISDEVSWVEGSFLIERIKELDKLLGDKKLILVNPVVYKGTVFKKNVVAVASLNPSILIDMAILFDESSFIKYIKSYNGQKDTRRQ